MMNPLQLIQSLMQGGNPMQMMMSMFGGNPQFQRACQMVQGKTPQQMQETARNLCKQRGIEFDKAVQQMQQMGVDVMAGTVQEPNPQTQAQAKSDK